MEETAGSAETAAAVEPSAVEVAAAARAEEARDAEASAVQSAEASAEATETEAAEVAVTGALRRCRCWSRFDSSCCSAGVVITTKAYREQQLNKEGGGGAAGSVAGRQVFVGNLPFHTSWQDLKDAFKSCGTVVRAEILQAEGKPRGAGTVLFETADGGEQSGKCCCVSLLILVRLAAQRAIRDFNEAQFDGRVITVKLDRKAA